ncbi:non-ribosomal peptide synthetase [Nocardia arizonensis]|uniref:non-ribosomal peptide synthetase n=1 Tax=Nocardia arizonensis TaxID=1141647 RepID=UPI001EF4C8A2|nr:non-ribosomal peptide synthetase [Nocardia arizonensis]
MSTTSAPISERSVALSVHSVFADHARRQPRELAVRTRTGAGGDDYTYFALAERITSLRTATFGDLAVGARVVMALPACVDYIAGFLAALSVGAVPVPIYLPSERDPRKYLARAEHVLRDCAPDAVYTTAALAGSISENTALEGISVLTPDDRRAVRPRAYEAEPDTVAFLQYSSGSTGDPKGVVNTHASVLRQVEALGMVWNSPDPIHTVSWLPLYHDMGMFWGVLSPLLSGGSVTLIPPHDFVRDPGLWLRTVSEVRGNWIGAPDFGYARAIAAFERDQVGTLDLSCVRVATNGAEPVRADTVRGFTDHFAAAGFRPEAMTPQYGLAEAGLAVSGSVPRRRWRQHRFDAAELARGRAVRARPNDTARTLVSCGDSTLGWDVRIVDPVGLEVLADGLIGEIWVAGTGLPRGYWGRGRATDETFRARTRDGAGPFLRTGDAGFRHDGELYVCGRYRDLIIVGGTNHFPQDLEATAESAGVAPGRACAVQPDPDDPGWVIVVETDTAPDRLDEAGRILYRRILDEHDIAPDRVLWVPPRTLPSTTSGKIRRREVGEQVVRGSLPVVREVSNAPESPPENPCAVTLYLAKLLGLRPADIGEDTDLVGLGMTSTMTAAFESWARSRGARPRFATLYAAPTLRAWRAAAHPSGAAPTATGEAGPLLATTPLQRAYWVGRDPSQPLGGVGCQAYFELVSPALDTERLRAAVSACARRHPMLRARFPTAETCVIQPEPTRDAVPVHHPEDPGAHLRAVRERLREQRFDPVAGDCLRVEVTVAPHRTIVHVAIDLIISDVTGIGVLIRDLAALYRGEELPSIRFIGPDPATAAAPADEARPAGPPQLPRITETRVEYRRFSRSVPQATLRRLDEAGRAAGVTRAVILLTCFDMVLRRWSTDPDFVITVTTSERSPRTADVVGDFTAPRLHRSVIAAADTWIGQMRRTRSAFRSELDGPDAVTAPRARTAGHDRAVLSSVVFTYAADRPIIGERETAVLGRVEELSSRTPQVLIDNQCCAIGGEVIISWDFRSACFPPGVVADMFDAYAGLIDHLAESPWDGVAAVDLPERSRRARELRNATDTESPEGSLYDSFRECAATAPDRVALRWAADEYDRPPIPAASAHPDRLTYGELDRLARRLARALRADHEPGSIIGIRLPKGPAQVVAVLGTLMAGCVYLPVSVDQPPARFDTIRRRSGMRGLIHDGEFDFPAGELVEHRIAEALRCEPCEPVPVDPARPAYIVYTSGSTGEPKGVVVSHAAARNTVTDINRRNGIDHTDSLLALSALDFDLSVYDIFGPLGRGAAVVTIAERSRRDAFRWRDLLHIFDITVWNSVPALMEMLLITAADGPHRFPGLRHILLSGDWIPLDLPARVRMCAPDARVVAMGGATEASIWSNEFVVTDVDLAWASIPYGVPLANQRYRVVDADGRDCPDHVAGELWIGGAGVASGYHNDPELTAARFRVDEDGVRWYRTGDLGCYRPDGVLIFLGRMDAQVKIRGHRVECGEVEHVLRGCPGVENAVVVPVRGHSALGCLLVGSGLDPVEIDRVRAYLADRLPAYLRPTTYLPVTAIPHSANGKVDRTAARELLDAASEDGRGGALSAAQAEVARAWTMVLGPRALAPESRFLAHGGDSLRATEVCRVLSERGVRGADVETLLSDSTLADFAAHCVLCEGPTPGADDREPAADPFSPFPLTRLQQGYVLGSSGLRGVLRAPTALVVVLAAAEDRAIDTMRLHAVLTACVAEFDILRCRLDSDVTQSIAPAEAVGVTVLAGIDDDPDALLARLAGVDPSPHEPCALRCYAAAPRPRNVALLINYLALDARSVTAVLDAIRADYDGTARALSVDAGAEVFRRYATTPDDTVDGAEPDAPPPPLPATVSGPVTGRFTRRGFTLDEAEYAALHSAAADAGATPTALILEAFTHALHRHGAGDRFAVSIPHAHRPDYAPRDREVLGNFTRLSLCVADYRTHRPGSPEAIADIHRRLRAIVATGDDATARIARTTTRDRQPGYPVVFTSTLGLDRPERASLRTVRTLTRTPGVALDCQIERRDGGVALSWDTADDAPWPHDLVPALADFERAVRAHVDAESAIPADRGDGGDAPPPVIIAAALRQLSRADARPVLDRYPAVVRGWRAVHRPDERADAAADAAGRLLADIVTGARSARALLAHPLISPEALLLRDPDVDAALTALAERVFAHARTRARRLRIAELGSRTGLCAARLHADLWPVVEEYAAVEPEPVLRAIAADRATAGVRGLSAEELPDCAPFDVVLCCGSLHRLADPAALLRAVPMRADGWLWLVEHHRFTDASLISAAVLDPGLLDAAPQEPTHWWRLLADAGLRPTTLRLAGAGATILALAGRTDAEPAIARPCSPPRVDRGPAAHDATAVLTSLWRRHLGVAAGPDDDFFLLGGDSLTATRIYTDLRDAGYADVEMVDLFNYPVLRHLAERLGSRRGAPDRAPAESAPVAVAPTAYPPTTYPLTPIQRAYANGRRRGYLLSGVAAHCYVEFAATDLDSTRFRTAVTDLVRRHPGLRTTVRDDVATEHADPIEPTVRVLDDVRGAMRDQVIDLTSRSGFDVGVQFLDPERGRALIGIGMDNLLLDGASMMTALAELDHLYRGLPAGDLPPLPRTFADHVHRRRVRAAATKATEPTAAQCYWLSRIDTLPPAPPLAAAAVLVAVERPHFERATATIASSDWKDLSSRCRVEGVTPSALLMACYAHILAEWSGERRFCLNVTLFDRDSDIAGIERVIGDFTSLILLECHVEPTRPVWDSARALQRQLLADLPHREADAVWLQRELLARRGDPHAAMFPVVFTGGLGLGDLDAAAGLSFGNLVYGISQTPQTVLDFQVWEDGGALRLTWDFVTQAIAPSAAERHLGQLTSLLAAQRTDSATAETVIARRIAEICAAALHRPSLDEGENFFRVGGDSVTATAVIERIHREITPVATLRLLLAHPVVADFAAALSRAMSTEADTTENDVEEGSL